VEPVRSGASVPAKHAVPPADPAAAGLDFGTATTLLARRNAAGAASVVPLGRVTSWLPSVARVDGAALVVGEAADESCPELVIRSVKRAITQGRTAVSAGSHLFETGLTEAGLVEAGLVQAGLVEAGQVDADRVITAILATAAQRAEQAGLVLPAVRLGCPAMWDGRQRRRLVGLATAAGLTVAGPPVDEPVAAGIAWLTHRYLGYGERPAGRVLVVDMGGGTLDIAVLAVVGGPTPEVSVLASFGVAVAGDALDAAIARDLAAEMARNRIDPAWHPRPDLAWALLERAAREAKLRLSVVPEHPVVLPPAMGYPHVIRYRREQLDEAFAPQLDGAESLAIAAVRAARAVRGTTDPAGLRAFGRDELAGDIDYVLLAGGMSRMPSLGARMSALFVDAQIHDDAGVAPEETVVAGLARAGHVRVSSDRPGFDLVLAFDGGRRTLYEGHTPLYQPWQIYNGHSAVGFEARLAPADLPAAGDGALIAIGPAGQPVPVRLDGRAVRGLPVRFGPGELVLRIGADRRIALLDPAGGELAVRAERWPDPYGAEHAGLDLRQTT
jgi:molecular chaperone DnaK (HSP70)